MVHAMKIDQLEWQTHTRVGQGVPIPQMLTRIARNLEFTQKHQSKQSTTMLQNAQLICLNLYGATSNEFDFNATGTATLPNVQQQLLSSAEQSATAASDMIVTSSSSSSHTATGTQGGSSGGGHLRRPNQGDRISQLVATPYTEADCIKEWLDSKLFLCYAVYHTWKARSLYIYGHTELAWTVIQKALEQSAFIGGVSTQSQMVLMAAVILLTKISNINVRTFVINSVIETED
jgi:hypothetical protein